MTEVFPVDDAALVDLAVGLARTSSVSGTEGPAVSLAIAAMEAAGFDAVDVDASGNAVGVIGPERGRTLMIDGHIDSIPLALPGAVECRPVRR